MTRDVQAVHSEYSRTGNDLKIKFLSNTKRMIAPGDILSFRLTLQNPKIKNIMAYKSNDVLTRKEKNAWKMKLFASHKHDLQCFS